MNAARLKSLSGFRLRWLIRQLTFRTWEEELWRTIGWKIRAAVSRVVSKLQAARVTEAALNKVSKEDKDNKGRRAASKSARASKVVGRTTANSSARSR